MTTNANLTVQDIITTVQLIDTVVARGAIRGEEMSSIGAFRDKLVNFLEAAQRSEAQASEENDVDIEAETV